MPVIAVGDIHGNLEALESLLAQVVSEIDTEDTLVFLGDYIDRGPNSKRCVERILELKRESSFPLITLMGNHEQWMLRSLSDPTQHSWLIAMEALETVKSYSEEAADALEQALEDHGARLFSIRIPLPYSAVFQAMPPEHLRFFRELKPYHRQEGVICAHGGVALEGLVDPIDVNECVWGPPGFPKEYCGAESIVYGHWNNATEEDDGSVQPCILPNHTYGIDTISHGVLTALRLPDRKIFQSARRTTT